MVDQIRVRDLRTLSDAAALLHDARFGEGGWHFDPTTGIFELVCWQLIRDPFASSFREWLDFRLNFERVIDVRVFHRSDERVPFYELSDLSMTSSDRLQIQTHYVLQIELRMADLFGEVCRIGSGEKEPWTRD